MPPERPKTDSFEVMMVAAAAIVAAGLIYAAIDGVRHIWLAHQYPADSVCARLHNNQADLDMVMLSIGTTKLSDNQMEREKQQGEEGQQLAEAQRTGEDQFLAQLHLAESAQSSGISRPGLLCLPQNLATQYDALFSAYKKDVASRIKAHPETCNESADADAMTWIVARFPCGKTATSHQ